MRGLAPVASLTLVSIGIALSIIATGSTAHAQEAAPAAPATPAAPLAPASPPAEPEPATPPGTATSDAPSAAAANAEALPPPTRDDPTLRKTVADRRAGIVLGIAPGVAFAGASGYPNNTRLIGNPDFYSESSMLVGASTTYFLMGALSDFLSFGPMVNIASFENDTWKSTGFGVGFRAEVFPLVRAFPRLADTSIYGQAGVGGTELQAKGNFPSADGTQSFAGIGLHHEFRLFRMLGGHLSGGPYAEYDAIFATSAERHWASIGFRVAWYGGTVTLDKR